MTLFTRSVFAVTGFVRSWLFRIGMSLVKASNWGLALSSTTGWEVSHWSQYKCPLTSDCRERYASSIREVLWLAAEPAMDHAGSIPWTQYVLIKELFANVWSGGRTVAVLALIEEIMASVNKHMKVI